MDSPAASRKRASVACRATGRSPMRVAAISGVFGPETRTTPTPPRPGAVAAATMVSGWLIRSRHKREPESNPVVARRSASGFNLGLLALELTVDVPLLEDRQTRVRDPVQHETRRE